MNDEKKPEGELIDWQTITPEEDIDPDGEWYDGGNKGGEEDE